MTPNKTFLPLYLTNLFGVMNDNYLKMLVIFVASTWVEPQYKNYVITLTPGALVLPYLIFSPIAAKLPAIFNKEKVVKFAKIAEILIMLVAIFGFITQNIFTAIFAVLLMGMQSALFSPSKYGLIKDIGGPEKISTGMGGMEAISFFGILIGTTLAAFTSENDSSIWFSILLGLAFLGVIFSFVIRTKKEKEAVDTSINPIKFLRLTHKISKKYQGIECIIHILSVFWWLSASLQMVAVIYASQNLGLNSMEQGILLSIIAIGISLGCILGGRLDKSFDILGLSPVFGILTSILLLIIFSIEPSTITFTILLFLVAMLAGIFKIPLDAQIQKRIDISEINIILAYFNLISFIYIFVASGTTLVITNLLNNNYVFLFASITMLIASVILILGNKNISTNLIKKFLKLHYEINLKNQEILNGKENENFFVIPEHKAILDPLILFSHFDNNLKISPLVDEGYFKVPVFKKVLEQFDAIVVPDLRLSRKGLEQASSLEEIVKNSLKEGKNILLYPSGHITLNGLEEIGARRLAYNTCQELPKQTKVIAIKIKGLWKSSWSRYQRKSTPNLAIMLLKSIFWIIGLKTFFAPKRKIDIEFVDISNQINQWKSLKKMEFNKKLEEFYNQ